MKFFRVFLASLLAFFVAGLLCTMVFLILIFSIGGTSLPNIKDDSVLVIDLEMGVTDSPRTSPFSSVGIGGIEIDNSNTILEVLKAIETAQIDDRIKGIYININGMSISRANCEELRAALEDFKQSGKWIVSYGKYFSQSAYYLASVADMVFMNPEGVFEWNGMSATVMFYKGLLDKLGIEVEVLRHGSFKAAVEPFILERMSPENKLQWNTVLESVWDAVLTDVSLSRGIEKQVLHNYASDLSIDSPVMAVESGLLDELLYEDQVGEIIRKLVKESSLTPSGATNLVIAATEAGREAAGAEKEMEKKSERIRYVSLSNYIAATQTDVKGSSSNKIAIIYADGEIIDGKSSDGVVGDRTVAAKLAAARRDKNVRSVILRVNSPGGSALASDVMWREMELLREEKPLIVSMGGMAASGGYYISCPADYIFTDRTTITGSIGVFGLLLNAEKGAREKLGLTVDVAKTNPYGDLGNSFRKLTTVERDYMMKSVEGVYATFVSHVVDGRNMTEEQVDAIGQGRIWSGTDAVRLGLADSTGGLREAIALAVDRAEVGDDFRIVEMVDAPDAFTTFVRSMMAEIRAPKGIVNEVSDELATLRRVLSERGVQARLPYEVVIE